jgi:serine/threonine protein phosphatase PrpC
MPFEYAGATDIGRKREHNEDALLVAPQHNVIAVADGMGGHQAGEVASKIAVTTIDWFYTNIVSDPEATWPFRMDRRYDEYGNRLMVSIQLANSRIREAAAEEGRRGMGTTVVEALLVDARAYVAWVGDSRGYLLRSGKLEPLTTDHSLQNELLRTGRIRPEDVANFQHKNVITRALGMADKVDVDIHQVDLLAGDVVVVCCDGLTGMLDDERIAEIIVGEPDLNLASQKLIDAANAAGGMDNITVVLARYQP